MMKQVVKNKIKAIISVICAFVLLFNMAGSLPFVQGNADEVQAAETNTDVSLADLTEISWDNYGMNNASTIQLSVTATTKETDADGKIELRFYNVDAEGLQNDGGLDVASNYETATIEYDKKTQIEFPVDKFLTDGEINGFLLRLLNCQGWSPDSSNDAVSLTIHSVKILGKSEKTVTLDPTKFVKGYGNGALHNLGQWSAETDGCKLTGTVENHGTQIKFSEPIDPNAEAKIEPMLHMTLNASTDDSMETTKLKFLKYDTKENVNDVTLHTVTLPLDGQDHEIEIPLTEGFLDENILNGLGVWFSEGPAYNSGKSMNVKIKKMIVKAANTQNVALDDVVIQTNAYAGLNSLGTWSYRDGMFELSGAVQYTGTKITLNSPIDTVATYEKKIQMNLKVRGSNATNTTNIRFYNYNHVPNGSIGNSGLEFYEEKNIPTDGKNYEIELSADKFLTDGKVSGIGLGVFSAPNSGDEIEIESIRVVGEESTDIKLSDCVCMLGAYPGFNSNGQWNGEGTGLKWSGYTQYSGSKIGFSYPVSIAKQPMVKFRILAQNIGDTSDDSVQLWMINKGWEGQLGDAEHFELNCQSGVAKEFTLPLSHFQNQDGKIEGFKVGVFTSGNWEIHISQVAIVDGVKADLAVADVQCADIGIDGAAYSGEAEIGESIILKSKDLYSVFQIGFTGISADDTSARTVYALEPGNAFNNTVFNADITLKEGGQFIYGAAEDGLVFSVSDGKLKIESEAYTVDGQILGEYDAKIYGIKTFTDTKINVKIATSNLDTLNNSATMCIWINNVLVGSGEFIITQAVTGTHALDGAICLTDDNVVTADSSMGMSIIVPSNLTDITWEDFGIACTETRVNAYMENRERIEVNNVNDTLFSGDVIMKKGSTIRYAGSMNDSGLHINVTAEDKLSFHSDSFILEGAWECYEPEQFGLSTFNDTKFNLKIAVMEQTETTATVGVWINNRIAGDYMKLAGAKEETYKLGAHLAFYTGSITPCSTIAKPKMTDITLADWKADVHDDGQLFPDEINGSAINKENVTSLIGTSFKEIFNFPDVLKANENYLFCYGGMTGEDQSWLGLRIAVQKEQIVIARHNNVESYTLLPSVAGVDAFVGNECVWQIDITRYKDLVLFYMYFNGQLYGNGPLVFNDLADSMSNTLVYYAYDMSGDSPAPRPVMIGASTKDLPVLYHNLAMSEYRTPIGMTLGASSKNDEGSWVKDENMQSDSSLTQSGDYYVEFNDGVSGYRQEVVLYDTSKVSSKDLVHGLKLSQTASGNKISEDAYATAQNRVCDVDTNAEFDSTDVQLMRKMLIGTYDPTDTSKRMEIAGYYGPILEKTIHDAAFKKIRDAGITQIIYNTENSFSNDAIDRYRIYRQLAYSQKYGMTMIFADERLIGDLDYYNNTSVSDEAKTEKVKTAIKDYNHYQAYDSLFLVDEPDGETYQAGKEKLSQYTGLAKAIKNAKTNVYVPLHKYIKTKKQSNYTEYLKEYTDTIRSDYVTYGFYPFQKSEASNIGGTVQESKTYFTNLKLAQATKAKLATYVQAGDGFESQNRNNVTEGMMKWNANTSLAFGSTGITYFLLIMHQSFANTAGTEEHCGLLHMDGTTKNVWYDWATDINKQVGAIDEYLIDAEYKGVMTSGNYTYARTQAGSDALKNYNGVTVTSANDNGSLWAYKYGFVSGCYELEDGRHALYVVNFNPSESNTITVNFGNESKTATTILNGETTVETALSLTRTLGAGEAVLVVY